ncbi:uncharacterized protein [Epargyreus clarus]|uniref:uncharacterized protein isoform X2 n=1 Tax=Epargyreus clarus TaxID=520877 RepID=UPI003C2DB4B1
MEIVSILPKIGVIEITFDLLGAVLSVIIPCRSWTHSKMARTVLTLTLFFFIIPRFFTSAEKTKFLTALEENLETKLSEYAGKLAKWLEGLNDKYLGHSELGRLLHYEEMKTKVEETGRRRNMKKMAMGMLPLIFHVGATSTWMLVTTIMTAKSVAIGMALLIFKIAVSSAKVAAFFTALKNKQSDHHHGWSWAPHFEHHESHVPGAELNSYHPSWSQPNIHEYKTAPFYKDYSDHELSHPDLTYAGQKRDSNS